MSGLDYSGCACSSPRNSPEQPGHDKSTSVLAFRSTISVAPAERAPHQSRHVVHVLLRILLDRLRAERRWIYRPQHGDDPGAVDPNLDYAREPRITVTFILEPSACGTKLIVAETGFEQVSAARSEKMHADNSQC
jgi:hypothetical protein